MVAWLLRPPRMAAQGGSLVATESSKIRVGLVGFGEVGSSLGIGLRSQGVQVTGYDKGYQTPPFGELIQRRAREAGGPLAASLKELVEASDLILAMVPGSVALEAATEAARGAPAARALRWISSPKGGV